ncbi:DUF1232 domain-containing protein [Stappia sp. GBMRC 2046]|uniref:DUF1232 domain-containing protein n=1 Tax=Stappia sediminis TaxID=2692190 RepID=A0A7X3LV86_9HYPH|nr:DUF1232 domain-containing protein [Stappia sediminis]MXN65673.1 DUF1232 domain-containing protein [Stappia sediminis]
MSRRLDRLKSWAKGIKRDVIVLWLAAGHGRVHWSVKAAAALIAAYALSPIDLIPDFIPVVGYLDDLLIVPLGVVLVVRMIPCDVIHELRIRSAAITERPISRAGAVLVVLSWLVLAQVLGAAAWTATLD